MITLPGYEPVYENAVYQKAISIRDGKGREVPCKGMLLPKRFVLPTEDEVVELLSKTALRYAGVPILMTPMGPQLHGTPLEVAVQALPDKVKRDLAAKDKDCMDFVRGNTAARRYEDGEAPAQFFYLRYGILPDKTIEANRDEIKDASWYDAALSDDKLRSMGLALQFSMRILWLPGLPDKSIMDILVQHQVDSSDWLNVSRVSYKAAEAQEVLDVVYKSISPEVWADIPDVSKDRLEEKALEPVMALHQMMREKAEAAEMIEKMQSAVPKLGLGGKGGGNSPGGSRIILPRA